MNALIRPALGQTVKEMEEEAEEDGHSADMNALLRAARGIDVKGATD